MNSDSSFYVSIKYTTVTCETCVTYLGCVTAFLLSISAPYITQKKFFRLNSVSISRQKNALRLYLVLVCHSTGAHYPHTIKGKNCKTLSKYWRTRWKEDKFKSHSNVPYFGLTFQFVCFILHSRRLCTAFAHAQEDACLMPNRTWEFDSIHRMSVGVA